VPVSEARKVHVVDVFSFFETLYPVAVEFPTHCMVKVGGEFDALTYASTAASFTVGL
jgi:hypothetical protein